MDEPRTKLPWITRVTGLAVFLSCGISWVFMDYALRVVGDSWSGYVTGSHKRAHNERWPQWEIWGLPTLLFAVAQVLLIVLCWSRLRKQKEGGCALVALVVLVGLAFLVAQLRFMFAWD